MSCASEIWKLRSQNPEWVLCVRVDVEVGNGRVQKKGNGMFFWSCFNFELEKFCPILLEEP